jgi:serine/threonine protein kinase
MERIGEYLVKRLVGEGGMGKVYEAEERLTKRRVALKVLRPELTRSDEGRRLFLNEMQILAQIEHPNVVRSLASMEVDGQLVMALEFLSGRTLRQEMTRRGRMPWTDAVEIVVQIAEALDAAHGHAPPIVHRDLKPENVMLLSEDGASIALKVMDFGIAKVLEAAHATNTQSIGTLQYMSPEQIDAQTIDARSDLYSLGLIFYEALAGAPPFRSASPRELLNLQCTSEPPPFDDDVRRGLPRGVEEIVFALLEKEPGDRPSSAKEVIARLAPLRPASDRVSRITSGARVSDTPPSPAPPRDGDTLHSPSSRPSRPRTDTIALVERATAPREVSTAMALVLIAALSIIAGLTTYVVRVHSASIASTAPPIVTSVTSSATLSRAPAR